MTTHRHAFLFALLFAAQAQAATPRCGTDDFGNRVCMDKDGVVSTARPDHADEAADPAAGKAGDDEAAGEGGKRPPCLVDPFGNTVCR